MNQKESIRPFVYGLSLYFLLMPLDIMYVNHIGSITRIVILIPVALILLELKNVKFRLTPFTIIEVLFCMLTVFSILYSVDQTKTAGSVFTLILNMSMVLIFGTALVYRQNEIKMLKKAMILSSWLTIIMLFFFSNIRSDGRLSIVISGSQQDPNIVNIFFLVGFCYHCYEGFKGKKRINLVFAALMLVVVLLTGSRGALLAFAIAGVFIVIVFLSESKNKFRNILLLIVSVVLMTILFNWLLSQMPPSVSERFSFDYISEHGTTGRTRIWKYFINMFLEENPFRMIFGNGYGTSIILNEINHYVVHNLYLDNLITIGLAGMLLQIAAQISVIHMLYKSKEWVLLGSFAGMVTMCMSLSLVASKSIWNIMIMALIITIANKNKVELI